MATTQGWHLPRIFSDTKVTGNDDKTEKIACENCRVKYSQVLHSNQESQVGLVGRGFPKKKQTKVYIKSWTRRTRSTQLAARILVILFNM